MLKQLVNDQVITSEIQSGLRKQARDPIVETLWFFLGLPLMLSISSLLTWQNVIFPSYSLPMISLVGLAYMTVWVNRYKSSSFRSYQAVGLSILLLTVTFSVVLIILASFRLYYSRMFLASSFGFSLVWFTTGLLIFQEGIQRFLVIKGGIADSLRKLKYSSKWWFTDTLKNKGLHIKEYDGIVIDLHAHESEKLVADLANASLQGIPVHHAASVIEEYSGRTNIDYIAHEGLYQLVAPKMYVYVKRSWEILLVVLTSVVVVPLALITVLCIKLESKGPALFTQQRVGKNGRVFTLYKFRSMTTESEEEGPQFAGEQDHRITRVGQVIRKYRIDELPQFWNVLKGDMSLIGPRPEQEEFVNYFEDEIPFYAYRHKVSPGITGWAQIKDGYADDLETTITKLEYDLYYVKNIRLSLDILIVYATLKTILSGFGSR